MKVGRNDPCPCGSGKKYKHCCYAKDSAKQAEEAAAAAKAADEARSAESDEEGKPAPDDPHSHRKDRSRFEGETKGRSNAFNPRQNRGSQRGG